MFYQSRRSVLFVTVVVMLLYMLIGYGFNIDVTTTRLVLV